MAKVVSPYLLETVNRPDLYTRDTVMFKNPKGYIPNPYKNGPSMMLDTVLIIFGSAFVFITLYSYCDTLRSWLDSKIINNTIKPQTKSRLIFSIIMTVVSVIVFISIFSIRKIFSQNNDNVKEEEKT